MGRWGGRDSLNAGARDGVPAETLSHETLKAIVRNPNNQALKKLNGPTAQQAEQILRNRYGYSDNEVSELKSRGARDHEVIATDPPVSEPQRKAMFAAASGHSTLGIPKKVGEEFVGKVK